VEHAAAVGFFFRRNTLAFTPKKKSETLFEAAADDEFMTRI
jgi:hypothetical protein